MFDDVRKQLSLDDQLLNIVKHRSQVCLGVHLHCGLLLLDEAAGLVEHQDPHVWT